MENLSLITSTIGLLNKSMNNFLGNTPEYETFWGKYYELLKDKTDKQLNYVRALCHSKNINKLNEVLAEWEILK